MVTAKNFSHLFSRFPYLQASVEKAIQFAEEGTFPKEEDGSPQLSGENGSECWHEGLDIRSYILRFYNKERLHIELPESFGEVAYEEKNEQGEKVFKYRKMTRCDILCTETQFSTHSTHKEIDMGTTAEAVKKREEIACEYLKTISKSGQWCSTPSLVAFAFLRMPRKPIRVYSLDVSRQTVSKYIDIVPLGCLPCCPTTEDEFFLDLVSAKDDSKGSIEKSLDDDNEWTSESEENSEEEEEEEEKESEEKVQEKMENLSVKEEVQGHATTTTNDVQMSNNVVTSNNTATLTNVSTSSTNVSTTLSSQPQYSYNFTRILFYSNHYDLLTTASERQRVVRYWPEAERYFGSFDASFTPVFKD